jgi:hypothetical protein
MTAGINRLTGKVADQRGLGHRPSFRNAPG